MDNYRIAADRAQAYFLKFDQKNIIQRWNLRNNEEFLFVRFLGTDYKLCRKTGSITRLGDGAQAGFSEVLSIFDLLCHEGTQKRASGVFASVNSLQGAPKTGGVGTDFHSPTAAFFDKDPQRLRRACEKLGGVPVEMGDIGYRFSLFGPLQVLLKFYHSDEDFPASITFLWDENTLQFMFYETVFYVAGFLLSRLEEIA